MEQNDRQDFAQARPFVVGVLALLFRLRNPLGAGLDVSDFFDQAESFVAEFERRYAHPDPPPAG